MNGYVGAVRLNLVATDRVRQTKRLEASKASL